MFFRSNKGLFCWCGPRIWNKLSEGFRVWWLRKQVRVRARGQPYQTIPTTPSLSLTVVENIPQIKCQWLSKLDNCGPENPWWQKQQKWPFVTKDGRSSDFSQDSMVIYFISIIYYLFVYQMYLVINLYILVGHLTYTLFTLHILILSAFYSSTRLLLNHEIVENLCSRKLLETIISDDLHWDLNNLKIVTQMLAWNKWEEWPVLEHPRKTCKMRISYLSEVY